jgi:large-conductance mechanosensitive channel
MALAVAIAVVGILTDGATTLVLRDMNGKEMNPLMNLLFRKLGFRSALLLTRVLGLGVVFYGVVTNNPFLILATGWLFMLASFVGLSSAARLSHGSHAANYYHDSEQASH